MKIILEGNRPKSWNTFYSGTHWAKRAKMADEIHESVAIALLEQHPGVELFSGKVCIIVRVFFKNRPLDADNIAAKFYIDGLIGRVITDDSPKYVTAVTTESHIDKKRPRVEIVVKEC